MSTEHDTPQISVTTYYPTFSGKFRNLINVDVTNIVLASTWLVHSHKRIPNVKVEGNVRQPEFSLDRYNIKGFTVAFCPLCVFEGRKRWRGLRARDTGQKRNSAQGLN